MSKFPPAREAVHLACEKEARAEKNNGFWCVKNELGKVIKPKSYFAPDLKSIYEKAVSQIRTSA